jgi:hypothetical protein
MDVSGQCNLGFGIGGLVYNENGDVIFAFSFQSSIVDILNVEVEALVLRMKHCGSLKLNCTQIEIESNA